MKKIIMLLVVCALLYSCKKNARKESPNTEPGPWAGFSIEKGKTIRTMAEVIFPFEQGRGIEFENGLIYDTISGVSDEHGIVVNPTGMIYDNVSPSIITKVSVLIPNLKPNTKYYVRAFRINLATNEQYLSSNEITIVTKNTAVYSDLNLSAGLRNSNGYRIGNTGHFSTDFYSKNYDSLYEYGHMLLASVKIYVDNVECMDGGMNLTGLYERTTHSGSMDGTNKPLFSDFISVPQMYAEAVDDMYVSVPCSFGPGNHDIKIIFDGYPTSTFTTNQQPAYTVSPVGVTFSKSSVQYDEVVYLNGLDSTDAERSHGILVDDKIFIGIFYDEVQKKHWTSIPSNVSKGTRELRLYTACDKPLLGTLTVQ